MGWLRWVLFLTVIAATGFFLYLMRPAVKQILPVSEEVSVPVPSLPEHAVAIIIDDLGHSRAAARPFLEMPYPVALSFLPGRPHTVELAKEARRNGKTLLLHLPMEPLGYPETDPGPGAILLSQDRARIQSIIEDDLASLPGIVGLNNHMGSKATADDRVMEAVLSLVGSKGLFFVDSRTTPRTVGPSKAREMGIPCACRDIFLDNVADPAAIDARMDELLDLALKRGWAIGIGHPHPLTAEAMSRLAAKAKERGVTWISLESMIAYADPGNRDILR